MPTAPPDEAPAAVASSISRAAVAAALLLGAALALGAVATLRDARTDVGDASIARASRAVGISAGAGFRGVMSIDLEAFRRGLRDGLAGEAAAETPLSRPERFARMRDVMRRLGEAEVAEVAERLDHDRDS
jgi:hypothetical protein